jgi:putative addiction module component (TIGR02574 family)
MSINTIQSELLELPVSERVRMIEVLWNSLAEPELKAREAAWAAEAERRIVAYESGALEARDTATVFSELRKKSLGESTLPVRRRAGACRSDRILRHAGAGTRGQIPG